MRKILVAISISISFIVILVYFLMGLSSPRGYATLLNFSTETKAECKKFESEYCHYICFDRIIFYLNGKEVLSTWLPGYACHGENWEDPRLK